MFGIKPSIMGTSVLVDAQTKGWGTDNEEQIRQAYTDVKYVGESPNLPSDSSDHVIASYCLDNDCDLLTQDKKAYTPWLDQGADKVHISIFSRGKQTIYLVQKA